MMSFTFDQLQTRVADLFQAEHVSFEIAYILAQRIMMAEGDGTLSHGLMRVPDYLASIRAGWITPNALPRLLAQRSPFVQVDGNNGFTQVAAAGAYDAIHERVNQYGIALLSIRNAHHIGAL